MTKWPLGVFSSIDAGFGVQLDVAQELSIPTIHLHTPSRKLRTQQIADAYLERVAEVGVKITCVFAGFEGESYADIPTVQRTVGLMPPTTRAERTEEFKAIADFAAMLKVGVVGLHFGFVPHCTDDPDYHALVQLARELCDYCATLSQAVHLETGQEPADVLLRFIEDIDRPNLFINFDPANMILYGCGEPLEALAKVGKYVRSVHCKDATWSTQPGETWGAEVALGEGAVNFERYLATLESLGYQGPLTIEREISQEPARQKAEIQQAAELLNRLKQEIIQQEQLH